MNSDKTISMFTFCHRTFQSKKETTRSSYSGCSINAIMKLEYLYLEILKEYVQNRNNITLSLPVTIKSIWI